MQLLQGVRAGKDAVECGPFAQNILVSPGGGKFSPLVQTGPVADPASCRMGTGSFPGVKCGRGVTLTLHPLLVPWP
jgi:hypothetical protein